MYKPCERVRGVILVFISRRRGRVDDWLRRHDGGQGGNQTNHKKGYDDHGGNRE